MDKALLLEQVMGRCVHFTGTVHEFCAAGLKYETENLPCFDQNSNCLFANFPSESEALAIMEKQPAYTEHDITKMNFDICPNCGTQITRRGTTGAMEPAAVYAWPCGHYLYERNSDAPKQLGLSADL